LACSRSTRGDSERCPVFTTLSRLGPVGVTPRAGGLSARVCSGDRARSRIADSVEPSASSSPPGTRLGLPIIPAGCDVESLGLVLGRCAREFCSETARRSSSGSVAWEGETSRTTWVPDEVGRGWSWIGAGTPVDDLRASGGLGSGFGYLMCSGCFHTRRLSKGDNKNAHTCVEDMNERSFVRLCPCRRFSPEHEDPCTIRGHGMTRSSCWTWTHVLKHEPSLS
jgi:hypothetical protein